MDYDLDRLGPTEFEHMIQALAIAELGISVTTFGAGRDDGREATFEGRVVSPREKDLETWNGYGIVQAKTIRFANDTSKNAATVARSVKDELDAFVSSPGKASKRTPAPRYYIIATNARLSPAGVVGGIDEVASALADHPVALSGHAIWHYEHICRLLDHHSGIRRTYAGFITPGDILSKLEEMLDGSAANVGKAIQGHAASQISARENMKLETAEFSGMEKLELSEIAIDLPAIGKDHADVMVVSHILAAGDNSLRASLEQDTPYGFVIVGGPGQGKSTLGQIVCQAYRVGLLAEVGLSISPKIDRAIASTRARLNELKIRTPRNRRWPAFIDLSMFADALAKSPELTAVEYITAQLRSQGASISVAQVAAWLAAWPWALVLDGLDEVPARDSRNAVVRALSDLIVESRMNDWDVLIVCTTRPQGYEDEFSELNPELLELRYLTPQEGLRFGRRIISRKFDDDPEKAARVGSRLEAASTQPHSSRLMRTPLQVTIMEYLLEEMTEVPSTRHELFDGYFRAIYARESGKAGHLGKMLKQYAEQIEWVHERAALFLQVESERHGDAWSSISDDDIRRLFAGRLFEQEYPEAEIDRLANELGKATKERLVLLVPRTRDRITYEVRSLQEYMAARAITSGNSSDIFARIDALAPSAYWRNTLLLALGRLYTVRPQDRDAILERLRQLDTNSLLGGFIGYGGRLAIDLLEDDFAQSVPAHRKSLLALALTQISRWAGPELRTLSVQCRAAMNGSDKSARALVSDALEASFSSGGRARIGASAILRDWERDFGASGSLAKRLLGADNSWRPAKDQPSTRVRRELGEVLDDVARDMSMSDDDRRKWLAARRVLNVYTVSDSITPAETIAVSRQEMRFNIPDNVVPMLSNPEMQEVLISVANATPIGSSQAPIYLRRLLIGVDQREARGDDSTLDARAAFG